MASIPVLGMDPSLNNWGLAWGHFDPATGELSINKVDVISPEIPTGKQVRNNSKDLTRAHALSQGAMRAVQAAPAVFVEVPVGSQSARAMASYGICIGVLGGLRAAGTPFFEVTPTEVKLATVGKKTAAKREIIERAVGMHPDAGWPFYIRKGEQLLTESKAEHMADAIGAIEAGVGTPAFQQLLPFLTKAA